MYRIWRKLFVNYCIKQVFFDVMQEVIKNKHEKGLANMFI